LTQLEAQAWQLPIVASQFCGEVVTDGVNGRVLPQVTGMAIAEVIHSLLKHPEQLQFFAQRSIQPSTFSLSSLSNHLQNLNHVSLNTGA